MYKKQYISQLVKLAGMVDPSGNNPYDPVIPASAVYATPSDSFHQFVANAGYTPTTKLFSKDNLPNLKRVYNTDVSPALSWKDNQLLQYNDNSYLNNLALQQQMRREALSNYAGKREVFSPYDPLDVSSRNMLAPSFKLDNYPVDTTGGLLKFDDTVGYYRPLYNEITVDTGPSALNSYFNNHGGGVNYTLNDSYKNYINQAVNHEDTHWLQHLLDEINTMPDTNHPGEMLEFADGTSLHEASAIHVQHRGDVAEILNDPYYTHTAMPGYLQDVSKYDLSDMLDPAVIQSLETNGTRLTSQLNRDRIQKNLGIDISSGSTESIPSLYKPEINKYPAGLYGVRLSDVAEVTPEGMNQYNHSLINQNLNPEMYPNGVPATVPEMYEPFDHKVPVERMLDETLSPTMNGGKNTGKFLLPDTPYNIKWSPVRRMAMQGVNALPIVADLGFGAYDANNMIQGIRQGNMEQAISSAVNLAPSAVGVPAGVAYMTGSSLAMPLARAAGSAAAPVIGFNEGMRATNEFSEEYGRLGQKGLAEGQASDTMGKYTNIKPYSPEAVEAINDSRRYIAKQKFDDSIVNNYIGGTGRFISNLQDWLPKNRIIDNSEAYTGDYSDGGALKNIGKPMEQYALGNVDKKGRKVGWAGGTHNFIKSFSQPSNDMAPYGNQYSGLNQVHTPSQRNTPSKAPWYTPSRWMGYFTGENARADALDKRVQDAQSNLYNQKYTQQLTLPELPPDYDVE